MKCVYLREGVFAYMTQKVVHETQTLSEDELRPMDGVTDFLLRPFMKAAKQLLVEAVRPITPVLLITEQLSKLKTSDDSNSRLFRFPFSERFKLFFRV